VNKNPLKTFCRRLEKIGIKVELFGNYPWIYLGSVNGKRVTERYMAEHGFTAFFLATKNSHPYKNKFTDRRRVFEKVREMLETQTKEK